MDHAPPTCEPEERAVIGAVLVSGEALQIAMLDVGLRPEHFAIPRHRRIMAAVGHLALTEGPDAIDSLTVARTLANGDGPEIPRIELQNLAIEVPAVGNVRRYAETVLETAELRRKREAALRILDGINAHDDERITNGIAELSRPVEQHDMPTEPDDLALEFRNYLTGDGPDEQVLALPWWALNVLLHGGMRRGEVMVLIGWTSAGKSSALDQILTGFHEQGLKSMVYATEMTRHQRVARYVAARTEIPFGKILRRKLTDQERERCLTAVEALPFGLVTAADWSIHKIAQDAMGRHADVIVIDPINLIPHKDIGEFDEIGRVVQSLSKRANCAILCVAQLNMARARDGKYPRPTIRDIRESGALGYLADQVLSVHREQEPNGEWRNDGELRLLKARNGIIGGIEVIFDPQRFSFEGGQKPKHPVKQQTLS